MWGEPQVAGWKRRIHSRFCLTRLWCLPALRSATPSTGCVVDLAMGEAADQALADLGLGEQAGLQQHLPRDRSGNLCRLASSRASLGIWPGPLSVLPPRNLSWGPGPS